MIEFVNLLLIILSKYKGQFGILQPTSSHVFVLFIQLNI